MTVKTTEALCAFLKLDPKLDLAAAHSGEPDQRLDAVAHFAATFGWLGRPQALIPADRGSLFSGESMTLWLDEIWRLQKLNAVLEFCDRLERLGTIPDWKAMLKKLTAKAGVPARYREFEAAGPQMRISEARVAVQRTLERRLKGQFSAVLVTGHGPVERFVPDTLAAALELGLARRAAEQGKRWVKCAVCDEPIVQRRRRSDTPTCGKFKCKKANYRARLRRDREQAAQLEGTA